MATVRSTRVSVALSTSPMPPAPRGAWISYGPSVVPGDRRISVRRVETSRCYKRPDRQCVIWIIVATAAFYSWGRARWMAGKTGELVDGAYVASVCLMVKRRSALRHAEHLHPLRGLAFLQLHDRHLCLGGHVLGRDRVIRGAGHIDGLAVRCHREPVEVAWILEPGDLLRRVLGHVEHEHQFVVHA